MQFTRPGTRGEAQLRPVGAQAPPPIPENILGVKEFGPIGTPTDFFIIFNTFFKLFLKLILFFFQN